ncbi:hypothetical protein [Neobacillus mesonae]|uniref:hypothetical protein n=1 Tax=Neobacillus mesonae TaxID=1193713 RepID=UPI002040773D|nr:hypothetical protein [Neobacillus mesonae]MCM3571073.1 hypothetical protein [Neobacillus mesonae]
MGLVPCRATTSFPFSGTTITTEFLLNTLTISITNVYSDIESFCIGLPCLTSFECAGDNAMCQTCSFSESFCVIERGYGVSLNPPQQANTTKTYVFTFPETFEAGSGLISIHFSDGRSECQEIDCIPVCS